MDDSDVAEEDKITQEEKEFRLKALQRVAAEKQKRRKSCMGDLLRSKGFIWVASTSRVMGGWQQAGNLVRLAGETLWMCEQHEVWQGDPELEAIVSRIELQTSPRED